MKWTEPWNCHSYTQSVSVLCIFCPPHRFVAITTRNTRIIHRKFTLLWRYAIEQIKCVSCVVHTQYISIYRQICHIHRARTHTHTISSLSQCASASRWQFRRWLVLHQSNWNHAENIWNLEPSFLGWQVLVHTIWPRRDKRSMCVSEQDSYLTKSNKLWMA